MSIVNEVVIVHVDFYARRHEGPIFGRARAVVAHRITHVGVSRDRRISRQATSPG